MNVEGQSPTTLLLKSLDKRSPQMALPRLIEYASKNKILLHLLRELDIEGDLRDREERRLAAITETAKWAANSLEGLDYALFKWLKPVPYVPADVDVIVRSSDVMDARKRLVSGGARVVIEEPYSLTLKNTALIDLYVHPTVGNLIYLDGGQLLENVKVIDLDDNQVRCLTTEAEVMITICHALYKEALFTLNDYFTILTWTNKDCVRLADSLRVSSALSLAQRLVSGIRREGTNTPIRLGLVDWFSLLWERLKLNSLTRSSLASVFLKLGDPRLGSALVNRLTRETY